MNKNIKFSEGNIKSYDSETVLFLTWSLPSKITCPYATDTCKKRCFAKKNENFKNVMNSRSRHFEETQKETFVSDVIDILENYLLKKKCSGRLVIVRIHTSGDFYNLDYFKKWVKITSHFKSDNRILFQCYTKSMPILLDYLEEGNNIDDINIKIVWSIWNDTPKEYTDNAERLGLQTFSALPKNEYEASNGFKCIGVDCANCLECYTGKSKKIVIPYH